MTRTAAKKAFLDDVCRETPEYADLLILFRELYVTVAGREGETGISFSRTSHLTAEERMRFGFPFLAPEAMTVDPARATRFLDSVIEVMTTVGRDGKGELSLLRQALYGGGLDLPRLFRGCLAREREAILEASAVCRVSPPLLEFVLETALRTALEEFAESVEPALVEGWKEGFCPVCGSRPGMAELAGEDGRRFLSCSACSFTWPFTRIKCPYCGSEEAEKLSYFEAGDGPVRVDVCRSCSRYIKTRDSRKGHAGVPLDAEDLATMHLDLLATREGFERGK